MNSIRNINLRSGIKLNDTIISINPLLMQNRVIIPSKMYTAILFLVFFTTVNPCV